HLVGGPAGGEGDALGPKPRQVARERGLGDVEALLGEQGSKLLLRGDDARADQAADRLPPRARRGLGGFAHSRSPGLTRVPIPLSVKSSEMMPWGGRPSMPWACRTPFSSACRIARSLRAIPPSTTPLRRSSSAWTASSSGRRLPPTRIPGTSERKTSFCAP